MHPDASAPHLAKKFAEIRSQNILPEELVALVERVLPLQLQARTKASVILPTPESCASDTALFAGSPLVLRQHFPCDMEQALGLIPALLDVLSASGGAAESEINQRMREKRE